MNRHCETTASGDLQRRRKVREVAPAAKGVRGCHRMPLVIWQREGGGPARRSKERAVGAARSDSRQYGRGANGHSSGASEAHASTFTRATRRGTWEAGGVPNGAELEPDRRVVAGHEGAVAGHGLGRSLRACGCGYPTSHRYPYEYWNHPVMQPNATDLAPQQEQAIESQAFATQVGEQRVQVLGRERVADLRAAGR